MDNMTQDDIRGYMQSLSNWGRWGDDDELGTLNLITDERRKSALAFVRTGETVSCSRSISPKHGKENPAPLQHMMIVSGEGAPEQGLGIAADWLGLAFHGYSVTHLDSLSHLFWNQRSYNNTPAAEVSTVAGAAKGSVEVARHGVLSRGVLLDIPLSKSRDWLEPGEFITVEDLERAEQRHGVSVGPGDLLLIRTGRDARRSVEGPVHPDHEGSPGLHASCLPWLREREVALLGSDAVHDVLPSRAGDFHMPIHTVAIVAMGLWLLDNAYLDDLSRACSRRGSWEFLLCMGPLLLKRTTGSPVNPIAVL